MTYLLLGLLVVAVIGVDFVRRRIQLGRELREAADDPFLRGESATPALAPPLHHVPDGYRVGETHAWARFEPNGNLRIGSDPLPLHALGVPEAIEIKPAGTFVKRGEPVALLRRGDRDLALLAPTAGEVVEVNREVISDPSKSGVDPFGSGWLVRMAPRRPASVLFRMRAHSDAVVWMHTELDRMRDLLTRVSGSPAFATMQDGGVPVDGISDHMDAAHWEEFKTACFGRLA